MSDVADTLERFKRHLEKQNIILGKLRVGDLNKLFAYRYRGRRESYVFPDDDFGLEDLKILIHTYAWTNPLKMARVIALRAPWAQVDKIIEEITTYPRKFTSPHLSHRPSSNQFQA